MSIEVASHAGSKQQPRARRRRLPHVASTRCQVSLYIRVHYDIYIYTYICTYVNVYIYIIRASRVRGLKSEARTLQLS